MTNEITREQAERQKFERWQITVGGLKPGYFGRYAGGDYYSKELRREWDLWKAATWSQPVDVAQGEPVAEIVSKYGDPEAFGEREIKALFDIQAMPYGTKLYARLQPLPEILFDGYRVYEEVKGSKLVPSPETVSEILDAIVKIARADAAMAQGKKGKS